MIVDHLLNSIQELFIKLTRMASIASDMFVGRERFATILLMRLTETVILWLADDQSFWAEIEEGPKPLGPLGLQQVHFEIKKCPFSRLLCFLTNLLKMTEILHNNFVDHAVLFGYGVCDAFLIPRPLFISQLATSY